VIPSSLKGRILVSMHLSSQIAKHLKDVFYGGNWTSVNVKDTISDIPWQQALQKLSSLNTIVALVYHMGYYVSAILKVYNGGPLDAKDKFSFDHPVISCQEDWEKMVRTIFSSVNELIQRVEEFPEDRWGDTFVDEKYGTYYRNLHGLIEHTHYHLGQVVVIKKLVLIS